MIYADELNWVKAGVEFTDGLPHLSVVSTRMKSDWSIIPVTGATSSLRLRLTRHADVVRIQYRASAGEWKMARLTPFLATPCRAGVMACSPERAGFEARFGNIILGRLFRERFTLNDVALPLRCMISNSREEHDPQSWQSGHGAHSLVEVSTVFPVLGKREAHGASGTAIFQFFIVRVEGEAPA